MGYFDKITDALFKTGENGESVYYPNGIFGKGRIIHSSELRDKIYKHQKRVNKYFGIFAALYGLALGLGGTVSIANLSPILLIYLFIFIRQRSLIRGLPVYDKKITLKDTTKTIAKIYKPAHLKFLIANGVILILLSIALPFLFEQPTEEILVIVLAPFLIGVVSIAIFLYLYNVQKSNK